MLGFLVQDSHFITVTMMLYLVENSSCHVLANGHCTITVWGISRVTQSVLPHYVELVN